MTIKYGDFSEHNIVENAECLNTNEWNPVYSSADTNSKYVNF